MKTDIGQLDDMKLYEFSENGESCKILCPATPRYWYNYLWNEKQICV